MNTPKAGAWKPPAKSRVDLLRQALAWQLQAKQTGGFSSAEKRNLPNMMMEASRVERWSGQHCGVCSMI
jgi:hypothetical protein